MRVLAVTNIIPTKQSAASGTFVEQQITSLRAIGVEVEVLFVNRGEKGMSAYWWLGSQVRQKLADVQPDVLHVMYGGIMADIATRVSGPVPAIVSFCGSDLLGENLSGYVRKLVSGYGVIASHRAAKRAAGVIVKSLNLKAALPPTVSQLKIKVLPSGVDLNRFKPLNKTTCRQHLGWNQDCYHVLFPANNGDPVKRPALARAAIERFRRPGKDVELHFLQGIKHDQVPLWLNASDVVLLTSQHEGSPNVIKEALACNVPVVTVDVGDVRERIQNIAGCYLALAEPEELAAQLEKVYNGSRRVEGRSQMQELSLERTAERLNEFYQEVVGRHGERNLRSNSRVNFYQREGNGT